MNNKKNLFLMILSLFIIGIAIVGGTFAYFQWTTGAEGGTAVNVTIEMGGITMHIEPEETEFVGLYPTSNCKTNSKYGDALVTIINNTGTLAIPSFKLKVRVTDKDGNGVPQDALEHIRYTVVPIETTTDASGNPVKGVAEGNCSTGVSGFDYDAFFVNNDIEWNTSNMKFQSVATDGSWSHLPKVGDYINNGINDTINSPYLPRQYFLEEQNIVDLVSKGEVRGITFRGEAYTTSYQYFRVYVWIDEGYTSTIVGNTVSDPLQNAKIEITWSEESMVQQVSGESIVDTEPAPGLYDDNDNMISTWDELITNGDITVVNNVITDSNKKLTGNLVIPEGITEIGSFAFGGYSYDSESQEDIYGSRLSSFYIPATVTVIRDSAFDESYTLKSITFAKGSQLTTIGYAAFRYTSLNSIDIPATVTTIGDNAFFDIPLTSITFAEGSQLQTIGDHAFYYNLSLTSIKIPSSIETLSTQAFLECNNLRLISFGGSVSEWNELEKGEGWNDGVPATYVQCSDGITSL